MGLADQPPPAPATPPPALWPAVAVDGKTLRGTGHHGHAQVHLLAVVDHSSRAVLAQTDVDGKTNETTRFRLLLDGLDLAGWVVTADALHTQREHADWLVTSKHAAYMLMVKDNQPSLHQHLKALPWRDIPARTTPATAGTAGSSSAASKSPPSLASTSPTPPRRSASPDGSGPFAVGAGGP